MKSLILTLVLTLTAIPAQAETHLEASIREILYSQDRGGDLIKIGGVAIGIGTSAAGTGVIWGEDGMFGPAGIPQATAKLLMRTGIYIARAGITVTAIGVIIAIAWPTPSAASDLTDYFLTPEGFTEYIHGTPEQMEVYANMDPDLKGLVIKVGDSLHMVRTQAQ